LKEPSTNGTNESVFREAHLRDYWKIIWQTRWTVLAIFVFILGGSAVYTFLQTPIYKATATIEVQPQAKRLAVGQDVSGMGAAGYGWFAEEKYHNTQVEIIKSRDVSTRVVEALDLRSHPAFSGVADVVESFRRRIEVVPRRETGLIEISILGTVPDDITAWVNQVADEYVERNLQKATTNVRTAIDIIEGEMGRLERNLSEAESERFNALESSLSSEEQEAIVREKLKTFNVDLTEVQIELSRLRDTLQRVREVSTLEADLISIPELADDPILKELNRSKIELERQLESAKIELRPGHPTYGKTASELAKVRQRMQDRVNVIIGTLQTRYDLALEHEDFLKQQIKAAETNSLQVAKETSEYEIYKTRTETTKRIIDMINKAMSEIQLGASMLSNNVSVLDVATPPLNPIKPRKRLNLMIGAVMGLFMGVAIAFFLDYLDNTFRTPEDVEKHLGLAVLGVIPKTQEQEGILGRTHKEAFQSLRTSIIFSSKNRQRKVILITSTGPQEGKSSTAANLARILAAAGDRVVIVDCDLRRPIQHSIHGVERDRGLTNYLSEPIEQTEWSGYIKKTESADLELFTCGPIPPSPPELLGSDRFLDLLTELREKFDWILLDSPPASSLADAYLLAAVSDMVVLVVQHNRTDRDVVAKTLHKLQAVNPKVVGAVLNNVDLERAYGKDYYYAGYYYEEGERRGRKKKKRKVEPKANVG
jgi:capsular exopolysaccharide synthesis family protein